MTIAKSKGIPESHQRLMQAIGMTVVSQTMISPLPDDEVIAILAFCLGAAIANNRTDIRHKDLRQMAIANLDNALQAFASEPKSSLILPAGVTLQ